MLTVWQTSSNQDSSATDAEIIVDNCPVLQQRVVNPDAWPPETRAWHEFLVKICPTLAKDSRRVLIELQGAEAKKLDNSSINSKLVAFGCSVAVVAVKDDTLKGLCGEDKIILIITFHQAQADLYNKKLDSMVQDRLLSHDQRLQVFVRTADDSQGLLADFVIVDFVQTTHPDGLVSDPYRLCLAMTRARQVDMVLMSRGIFVGRTAQKKGLDGLGVGLLEEIYEGVAPRGGVVIKDATAGGNPAEEASQVKRIPYVDRCRNCDQLGHREGRCLRPLKCGNCEQLHHTPRRCPRPHVPRCYICRSTEHSKTDCNVCSLCGQRGHKGDNCVVNTECKTCRETGHEEKNCPLKADRAPCQLCATANKPTKKCPIQGMCKLCGQLGHRKKHCPQKQCTLCHEFGHSHPVCPKRRNTNVAGTNHRNTSVVPGAAVAGKDGHGAGNNGTTSDDSSTTDITAVDNATVHNTAGKDIAVKNTNGESSGGGPEDSANSNRRTGDARISDK
jgi:hypothetical protein